MEPAKVVNGNKGVERAFRDLGIQFANLRRLHRPNTVRSGASSQFPRYSRPIFVEVCSEADALSMSKIATVVHGDLIEDIPA